MDRQWQRRHDAFHRAALTHERAALLHDVAARLFERLGDVGASRRELVAAGAERRAAELDEEVAHEMLAHVR
jgi:hypothetical protein